MTNNEIIFETVRASFTPAQLAELVAATYTAEHPAFDEVGLGEALPTYEVLVDVDDDDNMIVEFKRIAE